MLLTIAKLSPKRFSCSLGQRKWRALNPPAMVPPCCRWCLFPMHLLNFYSLPAGAAAGEVGGGAAAAAGAGAGEVKAEISKRCDYIL